MALWWWWGGAASPFKGPAETSSCQPEAREGRGSQAGETFANACGQGGGCRQVPAAGLGVTAGCSRPPLLQRWPQGARTEGPGAAGPAPPPGTREHPPPRPAPGGVGGSALETAPGRAAAPARPQRPRAPRTHWPSRAAASAAASARSPRPPPSLPAPAPAPSPWRGRGRSDAAALRALGAAPRRRRRPRGTGRLLRPPPPPPPPPAPLAVLGLRLGIGLPARRGRGARHGRGAARGRGPAAAGVRRGRGTWRRLPDAWVPVLRPLTSVRPRRPRARLLGSAPTSGSVLPRRPLPTCGSRGSGLASADTPRPGRWPGDWTLSPDSAATPGRAREPSRGCGTHGRRDSGSGRVGTRAPRDPGTGRGSRAARGCQTFLARGSRGRCRGTVKRNLPVMNSVSGNPNTPSPATAPSRPAVSSCLHKQCSTTPAPASI